MSIITGDARQLNIAQFGKRYGVIVADPPWRYRQGETGNLQGRARSQYETMADAEIRDMPINGIAKSDAVLFLWGTWPKLPEALSVMSAWGFEYITGFPWVKTSKNGEIQYGVGYWVRGCSEFVFIGRKGKVSPPRLEGFLGLMSPNLHHSRKPSSIHEIAETLPGPRLELFARRTMPEWDVFGNDIEDALTGTVYKSNCVEQKLQMPLLEIGA